MDPARGAFASLQARLDTFAAPKTKSRRPSARGKKPAPKAVPKGGWPLDFPRPEDLAYAGFIFKPTSASPDNVQCFHCQTQLDGWEVSDVPAHEHLTHSPNCGFAINLCIRLRDGDPGRAEDDPLSEHIMEARRSTFEELWPLDVAAGFPSIEQMVEAGWYYDPSIETPDGVTCPYCSLSLDAWDAGDDPTEEHRKRSDDCLFFALKEYYHPTQTKKPKATRGKRASTRSSIASTASKKSTRTKKGAARDNLNKPLPPRPDDTMMDSSVASFPNPVNSSSLSATAPAPTRRGRKAKKATASDDTMMSAADSLAGGIESSMMFIPKATPAKRGRKPKNSSMLDEAPLPSFAESIAESVAPSMMSVASKAPARKGRKQTKNAAPQVEAVPEPFASSFAGSVASTMSKLTAKGRQPKKAAKRVSTVSAASTTRTTRGKKRKSEEMELDVEPEVEPDPEPEPEPEVEERRPSPKRTRLSTRLSARISDFSLPQLESTPLHTPKEYRQAEMLKSPVSHLKNGTPKTIRKPEAFKSPFRSPARMTVRSPLVTRSPVRARQQTPEGPQTPQAAASPTKWDPIIISNIVADAGLDKENMDIDMNDTTENIRKAVLASLTSPEKRMTIEEFVLHNAKRGEEKLRRECQRQIAAFEAEGRRALAALDAY